MGQSLFGGLPFNWGLSGILRIPLCPIGFALRNLNSFIGNVSLKSLAPFGSHSGVPFEIFKGVNQNTNLYNSSKLYQLRFQPLHFIYLFLQSLNFFDENTDNANIVHRLI